MKLLFSKADKRQFDNFALAPPHCLLLVAPKGSGKKTILTELALQIAKENLQGGVFEVKSEENKKSIGIDTIRELKRTLKLKSRHNRVVLLTNAEQLTKEAQNSFLKLLEEPPEKVIFLLGSNNINDLLETIRSRAFIWRLSPPSKEQLYDYFSDYPTKEVERAIMISGERVGLLSSLLNKSSDHKLMKSIDSAKEILSSSHFKRMVLLDNYTKDHDIVVDLMDALTIISVAAMENSIADKPIAKRWLERLEAIEQAKQHIADNLQIKLVLTRLFLVV